MTNRRNFIKGGAAIAMLAAEHVTQRSGIDIP